VNVFCVAFDRIYVSMCEKRNVVAVVVTTFWQ